jgi:hypothetical protein
MSIWNEFDTGSYKLRTRIAILENQLNESGQGRV